jgi:hypothetical protein
MSIIILQNFKLGHIFEALLILLILRGFHSALTFRRRDLFCQNSTYLKSRDAEAEWGKKKLFETIKIMPELVSKIRETMTKADLNNFYTACSIKFSLHILLQISTIGTLEYLGEFEEIFIKG